MLYTRPLCLTTALALAFAIILGSGEAWAQMRGSNGRTGGQFGANRGGASFGMGGMNAGRNATGTTGFGGSNFGRSAFGGTAAGFGQNMTSGLMGAGGMGTGGMGTGGMGMGGMGVGGMGMGGMGTGGMGMGGMGMGGMGMGGMGMGMPGGTGMGGLGGNQNAGGLFGNQQRGMMQPQPRAQLGNFNPAAVNQNAIRNQFRNLQNNRLNPQSRQSERSTIVPRHRIAFEYPKPSGASIHTTLRARLETLSSRRPTLNGVSVVMNNQGQATLRGTVPSEQARTLAENLVRLEPGVRSVRNDLTVGTIELPAP